MNQVMAILGTGSYLPETVIENQVYTQFMETSDEWISTRTGIKSRHIALEKSNVDMAVQASQKAIKAAGLSAGQLDLILFATVTPDAIVPSCACQLKRRLAADCPAFDLNAACSGFVYGLETADGYLKKEGYQHILVVGSDRLSAAANWKDRGTCVLFGDGAGACVVGKRQEGYLSGFMQTVDDLDGSLAMNGCGQTMFSTPEDLFTHNDDLVKRSMIAMNGREVFKFSIGAITRTLEALTQRAGITMKEVDWIIPHQANERIISYAAKKFGIVEDKFYLTISHTGNLSSASVPVALDDAVRQGAIRSGDIVALVGFGGGFTMAGTLLKWNEGGKT